MSGEPDQRKYDDISPYRRFINSMNIDYEKWHDGIGYDLEALKEVTNKELEMIENNLINKTSLDWRDIEALSIIDSPRSKKKLKEIIKGNQHELNMAVLRFSPTIINEQTKLKLLSKALRFATFYNGLTHALMLIETYHPREIIDELIHGLLDREGEVAVHYAATLYYIYGKSKDPFDENRRHFYLKFNTPIKSDRKNAFLQLCKELDINSTAYLNT